MAMVYDNLKGSFKEGKATDESKNQSGLMTKELSALSSAGPEGHTLAYITPEEEKLLQKATGKETITTAYGIPTYATNLTAEQMEKNLINNSLMSPDKKVEAKNIEPLIKDYHLNKFLDSQQVQIADSYSSIKNLLQMYNDAKDAGNDDEAELLWSDIETHPSYKSIL